ncbi:hypothetical protein NJO91_05670 [Streptomyces microflavus]|nr:hypothetical protein [Streptomyces microflavus]
MGNAAGRAEGRRHARACRRPRRSRDPFGRGAEPWTRRLAHPHQRPGRGARLPRPPRRGRRPHLRCRGRPLPRRAPGARRPAGRTG